MEDVPYFGNNGKFEADIVNQEGQNLNAEIFESYAHREKKQKDKAERKTGNEIKTNGSPKNIESIPGGGFSHPIYRFRAVLVQPFFYDHAVPMRNDENNGAKENRRAPSSNISNPSEIGVIDRDTKN